MVSTLSIRHCRALIPHEVSPRRNRLGFLRAAAASCLRQVRAVLAAVSLAVLHGAPASANPWTASLDWRPGATMKVLATSAGEKVGRTAGDASTWPHVLTLSRDAPVDKPGWRWEFEHQRFAQGVDWLAPVGIGPLRAYLPVSTGERLALDRFDGRAYWSAGYAASGGLAWRAAAGLNLGLLHLKYSGRELTTRGASLTWAPALRMDVRRTFDERHALVADWQWSGATSRRPISGGHRALGGGLERRLGHGEFLALQVVHHHDNVTVRGEQDSVRFQQSGIGFRVAWVFGDNGRREPKGD